MATPLPGVGAGAGAGAGQETTAAAAAAAEAAAPVQVRVDNEYVTVTDAADDDELLKKLERYVPKTRDALKSLCFTVKSTDRTITHLDRMLAVQKLNAVFLRTSNYVKFCELAASVGGDRALIEKLVDIVIEGEALSFIALRLLCNLAHADRAALHLIDLDAFSIAFAMFRANEAERISLGLELLVLITHNKKFYHPRNLARGGGLRVLLKLLKRAPTTLDGPMAPATNRCNALLLLLRAVEHSKSRQQVKAAKCDQVFTMMLEHPQCVEREQYLIGKVRYVLQVWKKLDN